KNFCWSGPVNNWRYAFLACTLVAVLIWLLLFFWQRNEPEDVGLEKIIETECDETRPVRASTEDNITLRQYFVLLANPVILSMGTCYFCLKFIRYSLDTWTPTFLQVLHFDVGKSAYYSTIFDFVGIPGVLFAGWALDHWFKGKWAPLCLMMAVGMVAGYICVIIFGGNPYMFAICCGLVGFMLYGPDSVVNGAAAMHVAGEKNTTAVTGIINGMGSLGPVLQALIIGRLLEGDNGMRNANVLGLCVSVAFVFLMLIVMMQIKRAEKRNLACA
ncbi:MAG: MFS transporter, partial [bacterium]